jgi:hypothetical protein
MESYAFAWRVLTVGAALRPQLAVVDGMEVFKSEHPFLEILLA